MATGAIGRLRQLIVVTVGVMFIAGAWLARARSTSWEETLWITVYPIAADSAAATSDYIDALSTRTFAPIEQFLAAEAGRYGIGIERPVRMDVGQPINELPPPPPASGGPIAIALWSLKLRAWTHLATRDQPGLAPDISLFVAYHDPDLTPAVPHSLGLQKGMLGVVHAFAERDMTGANNFVIAHEILHTLGATDKYEPGTGLPLFPDGYADPQRKPLFPQTHAELMGGRIPRSEQEAEIPDSLRQARIGPVTASEIRWQ
jgi:hypothetical protein